jgi:hypothetical protein
MQKNKTKKTFNQPTKCLFESSIAALFLGIGNSWVLQFDNIQPVRLAGG